jgi:hypothetical protein
MYPRFPKVDVAEVSTNPVLPKTSQSPAVREMLVTFAVVRVVSVTALPEAKVLVTNSPTYPAGAESFVLVPL